MEPHNATGKLKEIYDRLEKQQGILPQVYKTQSLNPGRIMKHIDLYMSFIFGWSPLNRAQRKMMLIVVLAVNKCEYCQMQHAILHIKI